LSLCDERAKARIVSASRANLRSLTHSGKLLPVAAVGLECDIYE
jgi:hypothetical protein